MVFQAADREENVYERQRAPTDLAEAAAPVVINAGWRGLFGIALRERRRRH